VPEEIIHALGLIPLRLGTGGDDRLVELGARYISTGNCVFVRQATGLFAEGVDPYVKNSDLVVFDVTCKQVFRAAEVIKHYFHVETLILGVPYNWTEAAGQIYFRKEVAAFAGKLEAFAGVKLDTVRLAASVKLFEEIRAALRDIYQYQSLDDAPIQWSQVLDVIQAGNYLDKVEYLGLLKKLLDELAKAPRPARNPYPEDAPRLLLTGSIIPPGDRKLIGIIEELGGRVVADDLWSGFAVARFVKIAAPTLDAIADAYLIPHASLPNLDFESDQRLKNLKTLVTEFGARGIIYHSLRYCDAFTFKVPETKRVFVESGTPLLEIHTEYAASDFEAIRTRLEAFIELVKAKDAVLV
jgi:benzoyl-CoA reductase/2-hydroxyglutaryl-CoA dehydratase subunit BcrC/BadD/HgdB